MRAAILSVFVLLIGAFPAQAQNVAPPPNLAAVLDGWHTAMGNAKDFACVVERETLDKALLVKDQYAGTLVVAKLGNATFVRYEMFRTANRQLVEKYIVSGDKVFEFVPATNVVRVHHLANIKGNQPGILSFMSGMTAQQVLARFDMTLVVPSVPDKSYHYVRVLPKKPADKAEFREVRLSLLRTNDMIGQIWFLQPNGSEVTWNFTTWKINTSIPARVFKPDLKGWRMEKAQPRGGAK